MDNNADIGAHVLNAVGPLWIVAVAGMFLTAVCESAKPKPIDGQGCSAAGAMLIAGIASLITPILLFVHAFWSVAGFEGLEITPDLLIDLILARQVVVVGTFASLVAVSVVGSIVGWIIRAASPPLGKTLNTAAVPLALGTLALTVFVTYQTASRVFALATAG
jgi:hypothetical protein